MFQLFLNALSDKRGPCSSADTVSMAGHDGFFYFCYLAPLPCQFTQRPTPNIKISLKKKSPFMEAVVQHKIPLNTSQTCTASIHKLFLRPNSSRGGSTWCSFAEQNVQLQTVHFFLPAPSAPAVPLFWFFSFMNSVCFDDPGPRYRKEK